MVGLPRDYVHAEKLLAYGFEEQPDGDPDRLGEGLTAITAAYLALYLD